VKKGVLHIIGSSAIVWNKLLRCRTLWSRSIFWALVCCLFLPISGCRVKKGAVQKNDSTSVEKVEVPASAFDNYLEKLLDNSISYEWMSMRCKAVFDDGNLRQQFSANIRMKKDSIVWLSVSGPMGVEAMRLAITRDSFFLLNKINKDFTARPISFLNEIAPLNTSLKTLQNLLMALPATLPRSEKRFFQSDSLLVFQEQNNAIRQITSVHQKNYTTQEIMLADLRWKQDLKIKFDHYKSIGDKWFPFQREISVHRGPQNMWIALEVMRYTIDEPLSFPFEVNENYKKN
jgi:hypothetical protein